MARQKSPSKTKKALLLAPVLMTLLSSACVFGGGDTPPTPTVEAEAPERPAISRSGPEPTPGGSPTPRPTLPPPPTAIPATPEPVRSPVDGLVSVVYSYPFIWPAEGPITSFMSPEHPNGIDIGLDGGVSMTVRAAAGGTVSSAGGSDDVALGIAIVIDHGNGVSTTYGHLSALRVAAGDVVEIGQTIGIGGSTGVSTGNHLHFEVRKDGETVDPLHILPSSDGDTTAVNIDCATTPFTLPSGSLALINFEGILEDGEEVVAVTATPRSGGPALSAAIASNIEVRLQSPIDFSGPNGLDSYDLEVTVDNAIENEVVSCGFVVQRRDVPTTFYVRAIPPASDLDDGASSDGGGSAATSGTTTEPTPAPTATPNPWAGTPNYAIPTPTGGQPQVPNYGIPTGPGAGVQTPNYGIPTGSATPTP